MTLRLWDAELLLSLFKQCCLDVWNYSPGQISRQENIPTDGHFLREQGRPWSGESHGGQREEKGGIGACAPRPRFQETLAVQTKHGTQRGLTVDPETRSSTVFMLLISTCGLFSASSIVSGLNQAFWTSPHSGPQVYRGASKLLLRGLSWAQQALLPSSPPFTYLPLTHHSPAAGASRSHPKGFILLNEPELGKRLMTFLPPLFFFEQRERKRKLRRWRCQEKSRMKPGFLTCHFTCA